MCERKKTPRTIVFIVISILTRHFQFLLPHEDVGGKDIFIFKGKDINKRFSDLSRVML